MSGYEKNPAFPNAWRGSDAEVRSNSIMAGGCDRTESFPFPYPGPLDTPDLTFGQPQPDPARPDGELKDSGARREFETGAQRDRGVGDEKKYRRYDLLPRLPLYRYARHMGKGAYKYSARNWEKGMPLSEFYNSAMDHLLKHAMGFDDEDHLAAAMWNIGSLIEGEDRIRRGLWPKEFDDLGKTFKGMEP